MSHTWPHWRQVRSCGVELSAGHVKLTNIRLCSRQMPVLLCLEGLPFYFPSVLDVT